ncbi:hypothetical protein GCM10020331_010080 [Ectobacillus funiculus]
MNMIPGHIWQVKNGEVCLEYHQKAVPIVGTCSEKNMPAITLEVINPINAPGIFGKKSLV